MDLKMLRPLVALLAGLSAQVAFGAPATGASAKSPSLSECVALRTSGADRIVTARWIFAALSKSPQITDLSRVTAEQTVEIDRAFARLMVRIVNQDCLEQVRPVATQDLKNAFEQVGAALGEVAMGEILGGKEADKAIGAYADYTSEDDFKPLIDSIPKERK